MEPGAPSIQVLIVEDNPGDAELLTLALAESTRPRFRVSHAASMAAAVARLEFGARPDVVLLDLSLPDVAGERTVMRMREAAPDLPIVIMTGFDDAQFAERMVGLGAQDYLVKGDASGPMVARAIRYAITRMQLAIEREALVKELRSSIEMKNRMFGVLAHDLRNPVGVISGYAEFVEMLDGERLSERGGNALKAIGESAVFMDDLIKDVLSLAVAEAGAVNLVPQALDLGEVVRKAVALGSVCAERKRVRLTCEVPRIWVKGDALKLEQVFVNLIGNAIKFSTAGEEVTVSVAVDGGEVRTSVTDHGGGIPPEVMETLFEPFVKGRAGTDGEPSTGLGLYICSRIVAAHGGRIEVDSQTGRGTTFTVVLAAPATADAA